MTVWLLAEAPRGAVPLLTVDEGALGSVPGYHRCHRRCLRLRGYHNLLLIAQFMISENGPSGRRTNCTFEECIVIILIFVIRVKLNLPGNPCNRSLSHSVLSSLPN